MNLLEKDVQKQIIDYLIALKIPCWRQNMGVKNSRINSLGENQKCFYRFIYWLFPVGPKKTFLDIAGVIPSNGKYFTIEVKAPGKKPTDTQWNTINFFKDCNCVAFYTDSFDDAKTFIDFYMR